MGTITIHVVGDIVYLWLLKSCWVVPLLSKANRMGLFSYVTFNDLMLIHFTSTKSLRGLLEMFCN